MKSIDGIRIKKSDLIIDDVELGEIIIPAMSDSEERKKKIEKLTRKKIESITKLQPKDD